MFDTYNLFNAQKINSVYGGNTDIFKSTSFFNDGTSSLMKTNSLFSVPCPTCYSNNSGYSNYYDMNLYTRRS